MWRVQYRLYELDPSGRIVGPPSLLAADSDAAALREAPATGHLAFGGEVWLGERLVALIPSMLRFATPLSRVQAAPGRA